MELKEVIGLRRSVRYLNPEVPVEREKIQKMLEAARRASHWGNVQTLRAVVVERESASPELLEVLSAYVGNFQVKMAPVVIVWYLDAAAVNDQPDRLREIVDARAMGGHYDEAMEFLEGTLIPFFQAASEILKAPGISEVDCGQGIAQATLVAFDEGLGTCCLGGARLDELAEHLGLPEEARVMLLQTVGYPAEDVLAAGQRPRLPFEQLYFLNNTAQPFPRDAAIVEELEEAGMIQRVGPDDRDRRDRELLSLQEKFGYPEI